MPTTQYSQQRHPKPLPVILDPKPYVDPKPVLRIRPGEEGSAGLGAFVLKPGLANRS